MIFQSLIQKPKVFLGKKMNRNVIVYAWYTMLIWTKWSLLLNFVPSQTLTSASSQVSYILSAYRLKQLAQNAQNARPFRQFLFNARVQKPKKKMATKLSSFDDRMAYRFYDDSIRTKKD